jgi:hypothetical protein
MKCVPFHTNLFALTDVMKAIFYPQMRKTKNLDYYKTTSIGGLYN